MTIDEAIEFERYLSKQPEKCNEDFMKCEEHKQIAEWLEELQAYKQGDCMNDCEHYDNCSNYIYSKGYADAMGDLDILISEFLVPTQIENVCEELSDWGMDEDCETWCSRNCGVTNDGKCPAMNCYKEWIRMKKGSEENG